MKKTSFLRLSCRQTALFFGVVWCFLVFLSAGPIEASGRSKNSCCQNCETDNWAWCAESGQVDLFCPGSLAGWNYADPSPRGWSISDDRELSGTSKSTPLLSGFTADEGQWSCSWTVADGGVWSVRFPEVPDANGLELLLCEGTGCGRLFDGDRLLARGVRLGRLPAWAKHSLTVRRRAGRMTVWVDGFRLYSVRLDTRRRFGLGLALRAGSGTIADLRGSEPLGKPLFTGEDLSRDWWSARDQDLKDWRVEDGQLILTPKSHGFIRSKKEYGNFVLSLECQIEKGGNSGVAIRVPHDGWPSGDGMEIQILDKPLAEEIDLHSIMSLYGNVPPLVRADRAQQETWNRVLIKADGPMVSAWVNGRLVQQFNTSHHPEYKHRNLKGWIGFQDHWQWVRFRNVRLRPMPEGRGLAVWNRPCPMTTASRLTNRLLNSEALSQNDGFTSGTVSKKIEQAEPGDLRLADLTGPGALVRFSFEGDEGQLAFYFDGEEKPRLTCRPGELREVIPKLNEDQMPILTALGYEKSLRVVLRGAKKADYRIDYVTRTDPQGEPTETFVSKDQSGIPRGWLAPVYYRSYVTRWGVHREHDPALRVRSKPQTIEPGQTVPLAHVDGAGLVRWVKLIGGDVNSEALWIEATVDGESEPALSAPAKFWFPGLVGGKSFDNYLMVQKGGKANLLAMPFGRGITVSIKNTGTGPIEKVGIELSVEQATDANREAITARPRLRGKLLPAGSVDDRLFSHEGAGRWVGLIMETGAAGPHFGIADLTVDGHQADGWASENLNRFLGQGGTDFRSCLSGSKGGMAWRYLLLSPVEFQESIVMKATSKELPRRLVLYYTK